jgi:hypothetical protein
MLVKYIVDASENMDQYDVLIVMRAVACSHFYKLVQPEPSSFSQRSRDLLMLIDSLMFLLNRQLRGLDKPGTPRVVPATDFSPHGNARPLMFVSQKEFKDVSSSGE